MSEQVCHFYHYMHVTGVYRGDRSTEERPVCS